MTMNIMRSGSQPSAKGPAEYFTGGVRIDMRFKGSEPARIGGAIVTFEPGARTAWHTHPLGQTLIVAFGMGWVQTEGSPKQDIRAGDIVWIPPGEKHWHGATATTGMSHIAISEALDGKTVDWLEKVSDAHSMASGRQILALAVPDGCDERAGDVQSGSKVCVLESLSTA